MVCVKNLSKYRILLLFQIINILSNPMNNAGEETDLAVL